MNSRRHQRKWTKSHTNSQPQTRALTSIGFALHIVHGLANCHGNDGSTEEFAEHDWFVLDAEHEQQQECAKDEVN